MQSFKRLKLIKLNLINRNLSTYTNKEKTKNLNILMLGAPGVGKGTYGRFMKTDFNLPVLSSGDELRKVLNSPQGLGGEHEQLKNTLKEGKLAGDDFMLDFIKSFLNKPEFSNGIILDGYPRNEKQAKQLENLLEINLVVKIDLAEDVLIQKLLGRRVCKNCSRNYNIYSIYTDKYELDPLLPKKNIQKCDDCDSDLYQREDDNLNTIKDRLEVYKKMTHPLEDYYKKQGILFSFEMRRGIKDYYMIKDFITDFKNKRL
jgi:adenylate kinase